MFSFYPDRKPIEFTSNPPLPDLVQVVPLVEDGVVKNHVQRVPQSNANYIGRVYDPSTMSLRAMLQNGVKLSYVTDPVRDNDIIAVNNKIHSMTNAITSKYVELIKSTSEPVESKSE